MTMVSQRVQDVTIPLPTALHRFAASTTGRVAGNPDGPPILVLGGISGNRFVCHGPEGGPGWWPGLAGPGSAIDPDRHLILGLDFAADATGRCAPSTHDQAEAVCAFLDQLGLTSAKLIVGASYGGMVALSLAEAFPERVGRIAVISAPAAPHPAATAMRELQRRVVELGLATGTGEEALGIARGMAMMTYRTPAEFRTRFQGGIPSEDPLSTSDCGSYLRARGTAYQTVMSPERFLSLSGSLDRHQVDPAKITTPALLVGATTDQLVPPEQMRDLAGRLSGPQELHLLDSLYGHDMFLKEAGSIGKLLSGAGWL